MSFFSALVLPWQALRLIGKEPALRRLTWLSALVCALCFLALAYGLYLGVPALLGQLWPRPQGWWLLLWYPAVAIVYSLCFVIGALTVPVVVLAPIAERLSIETERALGTAQDNSGGVARFLVETGRSLRKALLRVSFLLAGQAALLGLWIVPGFGQTAWTFASTLWSMLWLAFEYVDITANRHGLGFRAVLRFLREHSGATLGLGAVIYVLLLVPVVNLLFIPLAVVSAAMFFRRGHALAQS